MNAPVMWQISRNTFKAAMTRMPHKFQKPKDSKQYSQAFSLPEKIAIPDPMGLFIPASLNLYHVTAQVVSTQKFDNYMKGILAAVGGAVDQWCKTAVLVQVKVNAVTAADGKVVAPPMGPLILSSAPMKTKQEQKYSKAIAKAVGDAWDKWAKNLKVPGLPWYPAFAAFPGPMAPPTPNIPVPLLLLQSSGEAEMSAKKLEDAMKSNLKDPKANHAKTLFNSLATGINTAFIAWKAQTMVTNVLGMGPIPSFAPPVAPVGPVVNGMGNMTPGGLVSPPSLASSVKAIGPDQSEALEKQAKAMQKMAENEKKLADQAMQKLKSDVAAAQKAAG